MPKAKANTEDLTTNLRSADLARKNLVETYKAEEKVARSVSPLYQPYLGKVIQISINGITIAFPINGTTHKVPQSFADEIDSRVMAIDATINKAKKMANIPENHENYPGELQMF